MKIGNIEIDKKFLVTNLPFVAIGYVVDKIAWLYRTTPGDSTAKLQALVMNFGAAFSPPWPSFHPVDLLVGAAVIGLFKLYMSEKKKNAKKWRHGSEYGSARWGTSEDIKPYMAENPIDNVILTQTEGITMKKPSEPKFARNKNILVIGGSGSGKTRFFVKPNLMQMHSSYVITDPKGLVFRGQSKGYYASSVFYLVL